MSSFTKRSKAPAASPSAVSTDCLPPSSSSSSRRRVAGYKPWTNGLGLVSSGNRQLDDYIGGGIALGTTLLIELDRYTSYGHTFLLYNLAEGISCGHSSLLLSTTSSYETCSNIIAKLPYNLSAQTTECAIDSNTIWSESKDNNRNDHGLKIAYQYAKYLTDKDAAGSGATSSSGDVAGVRYCNSFDLSRRLQAHLLVQAPPTIISIDDLHIDDDAAHRKYERGSGLGLDEMLAGWSQRVLDFVTAHTASTSDNYKPIARIFLPDLHSLLSISSSGSSNGNLQNINNSMALISRFVLFVKQRIRGCRIVLCVSFSKAHLAPSNAVAYSKLATVADSVLSVESFAGFVNSVPVEFREYCGFLLVKKIQQVGVLAPFKSPGTKFGLKRDMRKLSIEPLHLPPEESRAFPTPASKQLQDQLLMPAPSTASSLTAAAAATVPAAPTPSSSSARNGVSSSPFKLSIGGTGAINISSVKRAVTRAPAGLGCGANGSGGKLDF